MILHAATMHVGIADQCETQQDLFLILQLRRFVTDVCRRRHILFNTREMIHSLNDGADLQT